MAHKFMVCGSRAITDEQLIFSKLDDYFTLHKELILLSGGALGVDSIAEKWATLRAVPIERFLPDWKKYGRGAGIIRNKQMVEASDFVMIFWDGKLKGTQSVISFCKKLSKQFSLFEITLRYHCFNNTLQGGEL